MAPTTKKRTPQKSIPAQRSLPPASTPSGTRAWPARLLGAGAVLLILHGIVELLPALLILFPAADWKPDFIFEDLSAHWQMTLGFSIVCGLLRIAAAVGIFKNLRWGWILGILLSLITFAVLTLYLPMGIMDAVFSGSVLLLLLIGRYPNTEISG